MQKKKLMIGAVLVIAATTSAAAWAKHRYDSGWKYLEETNDAAIQADQVPISSKLGGYVRAVAVADNQPVGRGTLLVQLDAVDYETKLRAADAGIASAGFAEQAAQATRDEALAAIAQARAELAAASAAQAMADTALRRHQPLVRAGAESRDSLLQLTTDCARAAADVASRKAALLSAQRHADTLGLQSRQLAAQAAQARVERGAASNDLAALHLTSPVVGRVANSSVRVGQFVQPGARLMTVVPADGIYVMANFKETQVGLMRPGLPARIRVDALPGVEFQGVVASVAPGTGSNFSLIPPQNASGNFTKVVQRVPVRIAINPGPVARKVLVPGLSVDVEVDTRASNGELEAIRAEQRPARG